MTVFAQLCKSKLVSREDLDEIAWRLNTLPRKLVWEFPEELFFPESSFDFQAYGKYLMHPVNPNVGGCRGRQRIGGWHQLGQSSKFLRRLQAIQINK